KTGPAVTAAWARILREVPGSRLILKAGGFRSAPVSDLYRGLFRGQGIDPARVEIRGHDDSIAEHLRHYHRVHLALDPFPYCGTTTSCDTLWAGVPFVTLLGSWHAARVGASLLTAVGLSDLIARDINEYVRLAVAL